MLLAAGSHEAPANAIFGLFEPGVKDYNVSMVFNVSFPPDFELIRDLPGFKVWLGDKVQPLEQMSAAAKVVSYKSLAEAFGPNVTEAGLKLALKRPQGNATLLDGQVDPQFTGLDIYQFEFENDRLHELVLYALVRKDGQNYLCNVGVRTPALMWPTRKDTFVSVMASFRPLEPQPNRTAVAAPPAPAEAAPASEAAPAPAPELVAPP